jgi:uncharacterized protein with NRDE domain
MCLIVFAWQVVPGMPLMAAANRDEYYDRPAKPAAWWDDSPQVYAGRDLQGGGTWLGVTRDGRFAALTNIRAPAEKKPDAPTRGALVARYLTGQAGAREYVDEIAAEADRYNGFNLLVGDSTQLIWFTNRDSPDARNGQPLAAGIYGLSNDALDSPWPKVVRTKAQFASLLCQGAPEEAYFEMLSDTARTTHDCRLPKTGVSLEMERLLSAVCIESPNYGTRSSTVVQLHACKTAILKERPIR